MNSALFRSKTSVILLTGFIAGSLDILCAIYILANGNAEGVFRYIAKGAFGPAAYKGGFEMIIWGGLFHYIITFSFTIGYFFVYPHVLFLKKRPIINGLLYGIFVWCFMHFVILPLSQNLPAAFSFENAYKNILILMFAIGLPIALIAHKYYGLQQSINKLR